MDPNIFHMNLRSFHGTSYTRLPVPRSGLSEYHSDQYLAIVDATHITKNRSGTSISELLMKRKLKALVNLLNVNVKIKTKLKKQTVSQYRKVQPSSKNNTVHYCQNKNWTRTGIILNNNGIPRSYTLSNDKDNVIQRNIRHLIEKTHIFLRLKMTMIWTMT